MSENIRIIFDNFYDTSTFDDPYNSTTYYTRANTLNSPGGEVILGPNQATNSSRSAITSIKPTVHYILDAEMLPNSLSCLAFVRPNIPSDADIQLTMWNSVDWNDDYDSEIYTARLNATNIGQDTSGWGDFNWAYPWATNAPLSSGNQMANVLIYWFDDTKNPNHITFTDDDDNSIDSPVNNIEHWRLEITCPDTSPMYFDRIYLGNHMDITYNISHGHSMIYQDSTKQYRTDGGSLVSDMRNRFKQIKFSFSVISPYDNIAFARHMAITGLHKDMLISVYPVQTNNRQLETDYTLVGKFRKIPVMTEIIGGFYKTIIEVEET